MLTELTHADVALLVQPFPHWHAGCSEPSEAISGWPSAGGRMKEQHNTRTEMARRTKTHRAALSRLLDPEREAITLSTLRKAAQAQGREIRLELV